MDRSVNAGFAQRIAERMHEESQALAADWLARLDNLLSVDVGAIFPTSELLDHVPLLIQHIADYLRAPEEMEIAANTLVIEKAQELPDDVHLRALGGEELFQRRLTGSGSCNGWGMRSGR